jgi:hypothetical protein
MQTGLRATLWNAAQMYLVFQTVALPLVFSPGTDTIVKFVISLGGIAVSLAIPIIARRWYMQMHFLRSKMVEIEKMQNCASNVLVIDSPDYKSVVSVVLPVSIMLRVGMTGVLLAWVIEAYRYGRELLPSAITNANQFYGLIHY